VILLRSRARVILISKSAMVSNISLLSEVIPVLRILLFWLGQEFVKVASIFSAVMQSSYFCLSVPCRLSLTALQFGLFHTASKANP
jgi:hypothetical protein